MGLQELDVSFHLVSIEDLAESDALSLRTALGMR